MIYFFVEAYIAIQTSKEKKVRKIYNILFANFINIIAFFIILATLSGFNYGFMQHPLKKAFIHELDRPVYFIGHGYYNSVEEYFLKEEIRDFEIKKENDLKNNNKFILSILVFFVIKSYSSLLFYFSTKE